jgi:hypothetical protein
LGKLATSLIVLILVLAIPPPAAWANSIVTGSVGGWVLGVTADAGAQGNGAWNGLQIQFQGASFVIGASSSKSWSFSATPKLIVGTGPALWNSTLNLTLAMVPLTTPFYVDVFQFENGTLLRGETTRLTWTGSSWTAQLVPNLTPMSVPEPTTWILLGVSVLAGGLLKKRLT